MSYPFGALGEVEFSANPVSRTPSLKLFAVAYVARKGDAVELGGGVLGAADSEQRQPACAAQPASGMS